MDLFQGQNNNNSSKGLSNIAGFFILIGIALLGLVVSSFVAGILLAAKSGGGITNIEAAMKDPANAGTMKLIQVASVLIGMFIPALLVASIMDRKPLQLLGFRKPSGKQVALVIAILLVSVAVVTSIGVANKEIADGLGWHSWSEKLEKTYNEQVKTMLNLNSFGGYLLSMFIMALVPAVCEEMLFRGGLQNFLSRATHKPWLSIIIVSIIFSAVHFSVYGFLVRAFLGILLGLIFEYTKNIWLCILGHFLNNGLALTLVYLSVREGNAMDQAMDKDISMAYWGFLALPLVIYLFIELRKKSQKTVTEHGV